MKPEICKRCSRHSRRSHRPDCIGFARLYCLKFQWRYANRTTMYKVLWRSRRILCDVVFISLFLWMVQAIGADSPEICPGGFGYDLADVVPDEELARQVRPSGVAQIPKPTVVSRIEWGCPDGSASPAWPIQAKTTVTHLVVHHSDTSNNSNDWSNEVRSIFNYHKL
jgi:hypothetical protein